MAAGFVDGTSSLSNVLSSENRGAGMDSRLLRSVLEWSRECVAPRRLLVLVLILASPVLALLTAETKANEEPEEDFVWVRSGQRL